MNLWKIFIAELRTAMSDPAKALPVYLMFICGVAIDFGLLWWGKQDSTWTFAVALVLLAITPPLYVLIGIATERDSRQRPPSGVEVLLRHLNEVTQNVSTDAIRREVTNELLPQLIRPMPEQEYFRIVQPAISSNSVWAVCGRKSDEFATQFWAANVVSKTAGHHIERVFIPPDGRTEKKQIRNAITPHLAHRMLVRVFPETWSAPQVRRRWELPAGFGMTLIGVCNGNDPSNPNPIGDLEMVLIHWGGVVAGEDHLGVILKNTVWTQHFYQLFDEFRVAAPVANAYDVVVHPPPGEPMTWGRFVWLNLHYGSFRFMRSMWKWWKERPTR